MKAFKNLFLLAVLAVAVTGCATAPMEEEQGPTREQAEAAIAQARSAVEEAEAAGAAWRDSADLLRQAEEAFDAEDYAKAIDLAGQAQRQAENALAQKRAEEARMAEEAAPAEGGYTVMRGDTLWGISGKSDVYGDPYRWPLIFKANRGQISDADLIYPGQQFTIRHDWSADEVDAAVQHARSRGAWSLGTVEDSDLGYLAR